MVVHKHQKYNFPFYEGGSLEEEDNHNTNNNNNNNNVGESNTNTNIHPPSFFLPKPYHEDNNAPLLVLALEQSSDDNTSSIVHTASSSASRSDSATSPNGIVGDKARFANNANASMQNLEPFAQECLHLFNGEFTVVQHQHHKKQSDLIMSRKKRQSREAATAITHEDEIDKKQQNQQQQHQQQQIEYLFPKFKSLTQQVQNHPSTFSIHQHLLIKCHALRLQSKFTEPLFCSLELVDVKYKKRISERIWFHRNSFTMVNDFYEDLEMKRKVKDNGTTGGNGIFSLTNQQSRPNDIYVVLWVWRTLSGQTHDQTFGKTSLYGRKNSTICNNFGDDESESIETPTMTGDHVGLKSYMTPFCVSFAPLIHRGNNTSMSSSGMVETSNSSTSLKNGNNKQQPYGNDGFLIAMTHFLPPCSYYELFNTLIPSAGSMCSVSVTARPSHVTQLDVFLQNYMDQQWKNVFKKHKGIPGWFLFQVQGFNAHLYENDIMYRAYTLYMDNNLAQRLSSGTSMSLQDALWEIQNFNEKKYSTILDQQKELEEQEQEALRRHMERENMVNRRKSLIGGALHGDANKRNSNPNSSLTTSSASLVSTILNTSNQHLRKEPKSYMPMLVHELLPAGVAPSSPFFHFVHNLYIYPFSVDFTKLRLDSNYKLKPRNILLEISTREENGATIPRIYPSHYSQANSALQLQSTYSCCVTYDSKTPYFVDEIKIALPLPTKSHQQRVVFNFYHLQIEKGAKRRKTLDANGNVPKVLLATCELSMLELVSRQEQSQNLSLPLQKPGTSSSLQYYDIKTNVFKFTTQIESTIYPREQSLSSFFKDCSPFLNVIDKERTPNVDMKFISEALKKAINAVRTLMKLPFNRIVSHYTLIIDMLVSVMCRTPDILKNFVENMDSGSKNDDAALMQSLQQQLGSLGVSNENPRLSARTKNRQSVAANTGARNSRGSIKVEAPEPTNLNTILAQNTEDDKTKKNRFSLIQRRKSTRAEDLMSELNAPSSNSNVAKPGDTNFDLRAYLANQSQQPTATATSPSREPSSSRQSALFNMSASNEDRKKKRFSIFGGGRFGAGPKKDEPVFSTTPDPIDTTRALDDLAERQERRMTFQTESTLSDDIGDFLSVSTHLFDLQNLTFQALVTLLKGACYMEDTSHRDNKLLSSYVQYIFKDVIMTTSPFCFILCEVWTNVLSSSDDSIIVSASVEESSEAKDNGQGNSSDSPNLIRAIRRKSMGALDTSEKLRNSTTDDSANSDRGSKSYRSRMSVMATEGPMFFESLQLCWFWFDMILKSYMISVQSEMKKGDSFYGSTKPVAYSKQAEKLYTLMRDLLKTLADKVVQYKDDMANTFVAQSINAQIGFMLRDLMSCGMFPTEYVFLLLDAYLVALDESGTRRSRTSFTSMRRRFTESSPVAEHPLETPASTLKLKIALFHVLCDHPRFLAWNNSVYHPKEFIRETFTCPPVKLLAICTQSALESFQKDIELQTLLFESVRFVLSRYEQSVDAGSAEFRDTELKLVARIFYPYLYVLMKSTDALLSLEFKPALREHLKAALFILSNLSHHHLRVLVLGHAEHTKPKQASDDNVENNTLPTIQVENNLPAPITRQQFAAFLVLIASSFGQANDSTDKKLDVQEIKSMDAHLLTMSYTMFLHLANDVESWVGDCNSCEAPQVSSFTQFLRSPSSSHSLLGCVVFYIATFLQRLSEVPTLRDLVVDQLDKIYDLVAKLVETKLISTNCYWKWLYGSLITNFQFVTRDIIDEEPKPETTETRVLSFIERMLSLLHSVYGDEIIEIPQLPAITEEFIIPSNVSTNQNNTSSSDDVTEFGTSLQASSIQTTSGLQVIPNASPKDQNELSDDTTSSTDNSQASVIEYDENQMIKSATLEQLVWRLINQESLNEAKTTEKYTEIFFLTYRSFCTPAQVLSYVIAQFRHLAQDPERWHQFTVVRLMNSIKTWITNHPYDFNPSLYANLFVFLKRDIVQFASNLEHIFIMPNMGSNPKIASAYLNLAARLRDGIATSLLSSGDSEEEQYAAVTQYSFSKKPPAAILPSGYIDRNDTEATIQNDKIPLIEWPAQEVARQMTLIEYEIFCQIKPRECFNLGWSKSDKHIRSPNIVKLVEQFNKVSTWIATMIVKEDTPKKRGLLIKHWIEIANECRAMGNMNGLNTIVSALNNSSVHRLKKSWENVSQKKTKLFKELTELVSISGNYKALRSAIQQLNPPCVPYIGVYLTDLTFIEDGNKDMTRNNLINLAKRRQIARVIVNIRVLQQTPYQVIPVASLRKKLIACEPALDDSALYKQSLIIEPREQQA